VHARQLAEHGGAAGVRDDGLLESALARPQNLNAYADADAPAPAAAYAFGLARNHPFVDGNKRTAFVACELYLAANGFELAASDQECLAFTLALAAGDIVEEEFAAWLRENARRP
jgi:death-on-curing protein